MKYYTSTGTKATIERCSRYGIGLLMCNHWRDPRQWPYFAIDNGAFSAFMHGGYWDSAPFIRILERCKREQLFPDFVVLPDIVADAVGSLARSSAWFDRIAAYGWRCYLAVQDGMTPENVEEFLRVHETVRGIFVGGTTKWKLETAHSWACFAHGHGLGCHVGRIGPIPAVSYMETMGINSIDSTTWVQRKSSMDKLVAHLAEVRA